MFPAGAPGCGMFILRVGVAASLHIDPSGHFAVHPNVPAFVALATLSGSLTVGILTPFVSLLAGIVEVAVLLTGATSLVAAVLLGPLNAVVLFLLGPGAYSLDARLFGRRVVLLQPTAAPVERR
jgi:Zn-dependent protease